MPSTNPLSQDLRAIADIDGDLARKILTYLCKKDAETRQTTLNLIAATEEAQSICVQCDEAYDEAANGDDDCLWHDGNLEVDDDSECWADHYEDCDGPIDASRKDLVQDCPEGFFWDCCKKTADDDGCKMTKHRKATDTLPKDGAHA